MPPRGIGGLSVHPINAKIFRIVQITIKTTIYKFNIWMFIILYIFSNITFEKYEENDCFCLSSTVFFYNYSILE